MKVSLFVHDLSSNPIVRAVPIARALIKMGYSVEIIGFTVNSDYIYEPYRNEFEYKTLRTYLDIRSQVLQSKRLASLATGDIIYAFKPLWSSYFPALLASGFGFKKKLILDVEDNEYWELNQASLWAQFLKSPWYPKNRVFVKLLFPFTHFAKHKTVVCRSLQKKYGGKIVLHGPDSKLYNEAIYPDKDSLRIKYNINSSSKLMLFAGKPVSYNGLDIIIDGLENDELKGWDLVLAGNSKNTLFKEAKKRLGKRCHLLGLIPNIEMPEIIKMVDVVPILQRPCPATDMQIPAKLIEALSMGKLIVATDVCDIPEILIESGQSKNVISTKNITQGFINKITELEKSSFIYSDFKNKSIDFFNENASTEAIVQRIRFLFS
jgi:glycosyltransferase involved in cell wall biosynthesis